MNYDVLCYDENLIDSLSAKKRTDEEDALYNALLNRRLYFLNKSVDEIRKGQDEIRKGHDEIRKGFEEIRKDHVEIRIRIEENFNFYKHWNMFFDQVRSAELGNHYY